MKCFITKRSFRNWVPEVFTSKVYVRFQRYRDESTKFAFSRIWLTYIHNLVNDVPVEVRSWTHRNIDRESEETSNFRTTQLIIAVLFLLFLHFSVPFNLIFKKYNKIVHYALLDKVVKENYIFFTSHCHTTPRRRDATNHVMGLTY